MEVTAVVLHDGALAHYDVVIGPGGTCTAYLSSYRGAGNRMPPQCLSLRKEGRHWVSDDGNERLSEDLGYAVELKARPILEDRRRQGGHPAG
ncbi:hypothetical protein [Cnuella takakiae]|nr:hypothetical protein [Cnuella takakiae]